MEEQYLINYLRLSHEDEEKKDESNSITNQRRVQTDFIKKNEQLKKYAKLEFVDDGYSGTNFDRPGICKVLELVKRGKVYCIIVKDLSRFGRDYIEVGYYLEHIFPVLGVRFIAINDNFDNNDYKEDVPGIDIAVKNIMNSYMSQEQSYKVKKSIYQQRQTGEHVGASVPYGYKKLEGYRNKLFVDDEAAAVVTRIFRMTLEGMGRTEIARILNIEGILTPGDYKKSKKSGDNLFIRNKDWSAAAVTNILKNEAYIGTAVSGQHYRPEMGKRYVKRACREDCVIIKNAYPVIINEADFQKVQAGFKAFDDGFKKSDELLSGLLSCGHCGKAMAMRKKADGRYCYCDSHRVNPLYECNRELISLKVMEETVLQVVKAQLCLVKVNDSIRNAVASVKKKTDQGADSAAPETREMLQQKKKALYEEYKAEKISLEVYTRKKQEINYKLDFLENREVVRDEHDIESERKQAEIRDLAEKYKDLDYLTRDMLGDLVKRIYIYDKNRIRIEFKYQDLFSQPCE